MIPRHVFTLITAICMGAVFDVPAQPPPDAPPPPPQERPDGDRPGANAPRSVERWMDFLRRERPEEFAELNRLRKEDPEEFQRVLQHRRDRLRAESLKEAMSEIPRLNEFLEGLSVEERDQVIAQLDRNLLAQLDRQIAAQLGRMDGPERRGPRQFRQRGDPEAQALNEEIEALAREYRKADDAGKQRLKPEIRARLDASFDVAESERERRIQRAEERLDNLKETLRTRAQDREEIIAQRFEEIAGGTVNRPKD